MSDEKVVPFPTKEKAVPVSTAEVVAEFAKGDYESVVLIGVSKPQGKDPDDATLVMHVGDLTAAQALWFLKQAELMVLGR